LSGCGEYQLDATSRCFRVVMKEHRGSDEFARLGFKLVDGGKYSSIAFGVIEK